MPRRTKQDNREKIKDTREAAGATAKRRGRPKKAVEPVLEQIQAVEQVIEAPKKIVLKHFTEEEIIIETKRKRVMWVSVGFVAVLILFVWAVNLKKIVGVDAAGESNLISFSDFTKGFSENFKQINSSISELKQEVASGSADSIEAATTSETYDTNVEEINEELKELLNNSSTTINNN